MDAQPQQQLLHYIQLEPPPGAVWVEVNQKEEELVPEYDPEQMEKAEDDPGATLEERREVEEAEEKRKDAFSFIDGGSAGQSEAATDQPVETWTTDLHQVDTEMLNRSEFPSCTSADVNWGRPCCCHESSVSEFITAEFSNISSFIHLSKRPSRAKTSWISNN